MKKLKDYKQEHLLQYLDELDENERSILLSQIENIDFDMINDIYQHRSDITDLKDSIVEPLKPTILNDEERKRLYKLGLESIKKGEVSVVLMAGGQGTRLGHDGPKGTFDIGLPSKKSIFNIQCDKLLKLHVLTGHYIKWYIMTSEDNHDETVAHFEENNYFDYDPKSIVFFKQDRLPMVLENGQIALKSKYEINMAANGNGGVFSSLESNDILEKMSSEGNKWIFLYGVDNVLAKVADPTFVGFTIESGMPIGSKAVDKVEPEEKVGVICYRNNHPDIVEYSELSDELRYIRDGDSNLLYRNGNILSHVFSLEFLEECNSKRLPFHAAHKKVNLFDNGEVVVADQPNGYKFELFIFDAFKYANDMAVLTVDRNDEFAPVKNRTGKDSPKEALNLIYQLHKKWLRNVNIITSSNYELKTELTYNGEGLEGKSLNDIVVNIK